MISGSLLLGLASSSVSDKLLEDTNLLVYAYDRSAGAKHRVALELVRNIRIRALLSSARKCCRNLRYVFGAKWFVHWTQRKSKIVTELQEWEVFVNNGESVLRALEIEQQYQISFWDGLIINAAHSSGAEILYTEDLNDGQVFGGVWVVNPFKS